MKNDTTPATKSDINSLKSDLHSMNENIQHLMGAVKNLYEANKDWKDEIVRHFDVVTEDIRHHLEGANHDEIEVLKDSKTDHEQRIVHLEKRAGVAV